MELKNDSTKPIYLQIAEMIEDQILDGNLNENEQAVSTTQLAKLFHINPATAGKGINLLVSEGILFKKRGIGMFVKEGAIEQIKEKRKQGFFDHYIITMLREGKKLDISEDEIINMIKAYKGGDQ